MPIEPERLTLFSNELAERMRLPQRHRLLHGYPMAPLLEDCRPRMSRLKAFSQETRGLIIGVLPHPFCNPRVQGCGFCTFPHDAFNKDLTAQTTAAVVKELGAVREGLPKLSERKLEGIYLGGGTANLTPWPQLEAILAALTEHFPVSEAELTLEGVPIYFHRQDFRLLDQLKQCTDFGPRRISMGVQSFEPHWLQRMGRQAFGDRALIAELVSACHARDMALSCDLLCNLPGQDFESMEADVQAAIDMGFDQICLYHLVLFAGLDVPWAKDPEMLGALPDNPTAFENWRRLRARLLEADYVQTSLTNFERRDVHESERAFRYETASYTPSKVDILGFGPGAITCLSEGFGFVDSEKSFLKVMNAKDPATYCAHVERYGVAHDRRFHGFGADPRLLILTRSLAQMTMPLSHYTYFSQPEWDFPEAFEVLESAGLIEWTESALSLTEKGIFYADSVVGLLAWPRTQRLRGFDNEAARIDENRAAAFGATSPMG